MDPAFTATVASMAVALGAAVAAWWQARSAHEQTALQKRMHQDAMEPYVWADIRPARHAGELLQLVVGNSGPTVATDVVVTFDPPLASTTGATFAAESPQTRITLSSLTPGRDFRWNFDVGYAFFEADLPKSFLVRIQAAGPSGPTPTRAYTINLEDFSKSSGVTDGTLHEVSERIKDLARVIEQTNRGF
jgi:hypothetical protein